MGTLSRGAEEMKTPYEVIEKKEVLHECFAQLLADSSHLRQRLAIDRDDATHPLNIFRERILRIFHDIFTVQYQTEADMQKLLEQLQYARSSLQQLKERSVKKDIHSKRFLACQLFLLVIDGDIVTLYFTTFIYV